jgi:hypothetical protein
MLAPKGTLEAKVALFLSPMRIKVGDDGVTDLGLAIDPGQDDPKIRSKYGVIIGKCDGNGDITLDDVPVGTYAALIVSGKTTRDFHEPLSALEQQLLQPFFADDQGLANFVGSLPDHPTLMLLQKWSLEFVTVEDNKISHFSHDFGHTYI